MSKPDLLPKPRQFAGDDELNAVRYDHLLLGSENPHALTMAQIRELADYAADYGIALVPEIESLGHSTAKGRHYPELVSGGFAEVYPGIGTHIRKSHLAPDDPRTCDLLRGMYDEWLQAIRPPMIHLGLDEVRLPNTAGRRRPSCRTWTRSTRGSEDTWRPCRTRRIPIPRRSTVTPGMRSGPRTDNGTRRSCENNRYVP